MTQPARAGKSCTVDARATPLQVEVCRHRCRRAFARFVLFWIAFAWPFPAVASDAWKNNLTKEQFAALCVALAQKVDLFKEVWKADPNAKIWGGTTRDFMWYVRRQLAAGETPEKLKARGEIFARDFIAARSDLDIVTDKTIGPFASVTNTVDRSDPAAKFSDEVKRKWSDTGYTPLDSLLLDKSELTHPPIVDKGSDGIADIYNAKPTIRGGLWNDDGTINNKKKINRESVRNAVLLSLRYMRHVAAAHYSEQGSTAPGSLLDLRKKHIVDVEADKIRKLFEALNECEVQGSDFRFRVTEALAKIMYGYTNVEAAMMVASYFDLNRLVALLNSKDKEAAFRVPLFLQTRKISALKATYISEKSGLRAWAKLGQEAHWNALWHGNFEIKADDLGEGLYVTLAAPSDNSGGYLSFGLNTVRIADASSADFQFDLELFKKENNIKDYDAGFEAFVDSLGVDMVSSTFDGQTTYMIRNRAAIKHSGIGGGGGSMCARAIKGLLQ